MSAPTRTLLAAALAATLASGALGVALPASALEPAAGTSTSEEPAGGTATPSPESAPATEATPTPAATPTEEVAASPSATPTATPSATPTATARPTPAGEQQRRTRQVGVLRSITLSAGGGAVVLRSPSGADRTWRLTPRTRVDGLAKRSADLVPGLRVAVAGRTVAAGSVATHVVVPATPHNRALLAKVRRERAAKAERKAERKAGRTEGRKAERKADKAEKRKA